MSHFRTLFPVTFALSVLLCAGQARAQTVPYGNSKYPVGSPYSQDFSALGTTAQTWADGSATIPTLPGWYSSRVGTSLQVNSGTSSTGSLYNYGSASSVADRALGSLADSTTGTIQYGVAIKNITTSSLSNIQIGYTGEEWRGTTGNTSPNTLTFGYLVVASSDATNHINDSSASYTSVSGLAFSAPKYNTATGIPSDTALVGNASGNYTNLSAMLSGVTLAPNQTLWLRWTDVNDTGNNQGLAIDNFSFTATPEPSGLVSMGIGLGMAGLGALARRRRQARQQDAEGVSPE